LNSIVSKAAIGNRGIHRQSFSDGDKITYFLGD